MFFIAFGRFDLFGFIFANIINYIFVVVFYFKYHFLWLKNHLSTIWISPHTYYFLLNICTNA